MKKKQVLTLILTIITSFVYGQNKKELNDSINKLQAESKSLELKIEGNTLLISSLNKKILDSKELNTDLHEKNRIQLLEFQKIEELMKESQSTNTGLRDSIGKLQVESNSLELNIEENTLLISSLNKKNLDFKELNTDLHEKIEFICWNFKKLKS